MNSMEEEGVKVEIRKVSNECLTPFFKVELSFIVVLVPDTLFSNECLTPLLPFELFSYD